MRNLFISDLHLMPERPDLAQGFFDFVRTQAVGAAALYILGDFFDNWIGDDLMDPFQERVAEALAALAAAGTQIFVMHGNRDFLLGETFCRQAGCKLLPDPSLIELAGQRLLLLHGDSLCTGDRMYMRYRRLVRSPVLKSLFLRLPTSWRRGIARQLRTKSRGNRARSMGVYTDVSPDAITAALAAYEADSMIHGHTHKPAVHNLAGGGRRWVLGDWGHQGWCLYHDEEGFRLEHFPIQSCST
ncbi:MAG: UDP-2,3-diacylglucosamine diphosphatase [Kistimonas sp.]|nr:UDP-2,3-diacylglucosamine diphosphatase [Kistimonas sp.]